MIITEKLHLEHLDRALPGIKGYNKQTTHQKVKIFLHMIRRFGSYCIRSMHGEHLTELLSFALNLSYNGAAKFILINTNTAIRNYTKNRTICVIRSDEDVFVKHCRNKQQHFYICDDDTLLVKC